MNHSPRACLHFFSLVGCATGLLLSRAEAAFLRVDPSGGGDYLTVQAAMAASSAGDSIAVKEGLHTVTNVQVKQGVQLLGGWNSSFTMRVPGTSHLIPGGSGTILRLSTGQTTATVIDGFELSGATQSAIWCTSASATITNNNIHDNVASDGGAIHCEYGASPVIEHNHVHHNHAGYGGGIRGHWGFGTSPTIRSNLIEYNSANAAGGGIGVNNGSPLIENNIIQFNQTDTGGTATGGGVHVWHAEGGIAEVRHNLIIYNSSAEGGGIGITGGHPIIENNTLWGNQATRGGALYQEESILPDPGTTRVSHNILAGSTSGNAVYVESDPAMDLQCNCVFGNAGGTYYGIPAGSTDIAADPLFCDLSAFLLQSNSPCAPSGACGLVGAFGVGCGAVSIEPTTWARTKAMYR